MIARQMMTLRSLGLGALALVLALVASGLGPVETASAYVPGSVNKTVTVTGADGNLVAGALVAFVYEDGTSEALTSNVSTDASGVAVVAIDAALEVLGLAVSPGASDTANALYFAQAGNDLALTPSAQSFAVQLEAADITADLKLENSSAAPNGSMIAWEVPDTDLGSQVRILRSGPVGIALPGAAESYPVYEEGDASYTFGYFVTGGHSGSGYFPSYYDFARVADVAGTETYGFISYGSPFSPTSLNNYTFVLRESNFSGQFVQSSSSISLPTGVTASIRFIEAADSSTIPPIQDTGRMGRSEIANVAADGSFAGFVDYMPGSSDDPVAYFPQVFFEGDANYPVFTGDPVWMWNGKFTTTSPWTGGLDTTGISATTAPIEIPASPGAKNIIIQAVAAGTSTAQAADINIISMDGQQWFGTVSSSTGIASYNLADGDYQMEIMPTERRMGTKRYKIVVASGTPTVFVDEGDDTSAVSGDGGATETFKVSGRVNPDFQVIVADPLNGDALIPKAEAHVEYCSTTECFGIGANEHNGVIQVQVPADIVSGMEGTLVIRPPSSGAYPLLTSKRITLSWVSGNPVLKDGDTVLTAIADADADTYLVALGAANLSGKVFDPSGTTPIAYSGIAVVDASGQELWQYHTETNDAGEWALSLPTGTYDLYATSPWGQSDYGRSVLATSVVIDANGDATSVPSPSTAFSFNFNLTFPTWSGTVVNPVDGNVVTNAEVCLYTSTSHACAQVDNNGRWALSAPDGYTSYGVSDELQVREYSSPLYADQLYRGTTQLSAALGSFTQNQQETDITLTLGQPNVLLTIQAGGTAVPYAWVNLESNFSWLGGASTDENGVARFSIDSPEDGFDVRVEISHLDINGTYTSTKKSYSSGDATTAMGGTSVFTQTVALDTPNLKLLVKGSGGSPHPNAWVELFDASTNEWIAGSQSSSTGAASLNVPLPDTGSKNYTLRINPAWNDSTGDARMDYQVVADSADDSVTVTGGTAPDGTYTVPLASPNLTGVVRNSSDSSTVSDSWVSPYDTTTGEHLWNYGANSGSTGAFSMLLPDGSYELQAQVPWNLSGLASSARCAITVTSLVVSSSDAGCYSGSMTLTLRQPNLQFTLMDNGTPVPFANVGIAVADWSVHAQSDLNGQVSLFLDETAMKAAADLWISSGWMSAGVIPLRVWVDPPYGSGEIVRWECESGDASPICSDAAFTGLDKTGGTWAAWSDPGDLGNIEFKRPNTKIDILYPGGTAVGEGAWVGLFVKKTDGGGGSWREWIGGGQTSSTGSVAFNIADANLGETFSIEVNPPWYEQESYATKFYDDLVLSSADGSGIRALQTAGGSSDFRLSSPNLTLSLFESDSTTVSKYAWISVELMDESDGSHEWFSGSGTNFQGKATLMLPAQTGKHYRLNFYPGPYSEGTEFSCYLTSSGSDVVGAFSPTDTATYSSGNGYSSCGAPAAGALSKSFAAGNLSGTIQDSNGDAIAGAIVVAVGSSGGKELVATNATGEFFFDVDDTAETWTLKVISVDDTYTDRTDATQSSGADDDVKSVSFSSNASTGNTITLVG